MSYSPFKITVCACLVAHFSEAQFAVAQDNRNPQTLDEIFVTATKRVENAQDVPISISTFSGEVLEILRPRGLSDLSQHVSNMYMPPAGEAGASAIAIRGIGSGIAKSSGRGVGVYIDGVYVNSDTALDVALADIASVEVLKGPQGTLFGRDTIGGAVNIITNTPANVLGGSLKIEAGNYGYRQATGFIDVPLAQDKLAMRLSALRAKRDGHIENTLNGNKADAYSHTGVSAQFYATPTENFDARLSYSYGHKDDRPNSAGESTTNLGSDNIPYTINLGQEEIQTQTAHRLSLRTNTNIGDGFTLITIAGLSRTEDFYIQDGDRLPQAITVQQFESLWEEESIEIRLASPQDKRLSYVIGGYYLRAQRDYAPTFPLMSTAFLNQVFFLPEAQHPADELDGQNIDMTSKNLAAFAHGQFDLTDTLQFFGGLRLTKDTKQIDYRSFGEVFTLFGLPPLQHRSQTKDTPLSWTVGARYEVMEDVQTYGSVSRGYRSASIKDDFVSQADIDAGRGFFTKPEFVTNYEIGVKSTLLDGRVRANASAFYMDYTDIQVSIADPTFTFLRNLTNAASAHISGFESDVVAKISDNLQVNASVGHVKTRYDEFTPNPGDDRADTGFDTAPTWTFNAGVDYEYDLARGGLLDGGAAKFHIDYLDRTAPNDFVFETLAFVGDHATVNAWIGYVPPHEKWQFKFWVKNLTDSHDPQVNFHWGSGLGPLLDNITVQYERPRSYGVSLDMIIGG